MSEQLKSLVADLAHAKSAEKIANQNRISVELEIFMMVKGELVPKGTNNFVDANLKIVTGFSEKWDQAKLAEIKNNWTHETAFPFKVELKPTTGGMNYIKEFAPDGYKEIEQALTLKEKKPAFTVVTDE